MSEKQKKNIKRAVSAFLILFLIWFYIRVGCPFKWLTGISCPGCGMSRAVVSLFRLDFNSAFYYHPLVFLLPPVFFLYLLRGHFAKRVKIMLFVTLLAVMLSVYIYRMMSGSEIVYFNPSSGEIYKLCKNIIK